MSAESLKFVAMKIKDGFTGSIGNTPLIRLRRLSDETGCEILGKAEFMNPGGSVKDRAAKWIVLEAERIAIEAQRALNVRHPDHRV